MICDLGRGDLGSGLEDVAGTGIGLRHRDPGNVGCLGLGSRRRGRRDALLGLVRRPAGFGVVVVVVALGDVGKLGAGVARGNRLVLLLGLFFLSEQ
ncbi:MAG: hypothetical protein GEU71_04405 [Actinobacteria bacterium]|nr:hypothetical protein [Actinomycetota bacterium]